jgi:hypothetical protein
VAQRKVLMGRENEKFLVKEPKLSSPPHTLTHSCCYSLNFKEINLAGIISYLYFLVTKRNEKGKTFHFESEKLFNHKFKCVRNIKYSSVLISNSRSVNSSCGKN